LGRPRGGTRLVRITIFQMKLVHTLIFWVLSLCVAYALFSGVADRITMWTWVAVDPCRAQGSGARLRD
jgi:hypothetical protein